MTWYEIYDNCYINLDKFWKIEVEQNLDGLYCLYGHRMENEVELLMTRDREDELVTILKDIMYVSRDRD